MFGQVWLSVGKDGTNDLGTVFSVKGIGIDEAQQITFMGETNLFPSAAYADARNAMINAATNLYGPFSCELVNVTNAWYAVGVGTPFHYSNVFLSGPQTASTSNTTFTFNACSTVSSINWTHSDNLAYINGQGTNNYTVQAVNCSVSGMGWVKAIVNTFNSTDTLERNVWAGVPIIDSIRLLTNTYSIGPNSTIEVLGLSPGAESYNWTVAGATIISGQGTSDIWIQTASGVPVCPVDLTIQLTTSNSCGNSQTFMKSFPFDCSGGPNPLSVSPNPASQTLTVELTDTTSTATSQTVNESFTVQLFNAYNKPVYRTRETLRRFTINVSGYRPGMYYLRVTKGNNVYVNKVIIAVH